MDKDVTTTSLGRAPGALGSPVDDPAAEFERVLAGLAGDPSMRQFKAEYEKLLGALRRAHGNEWILVNKVKELNDEIVSNAGRVQQALRMSEEDALTIDELKKQVERAWGMAEAANTREEAANQSIERLKAEATQLQAVLSRYSSLLGEDRLEDVVAVRDSLRAKLHDVEQQAAHERQRADGLAAELAARNGKYREKKAEAKDLERQLAQKAAEEAKAARTRAALEGDLSTMRDQLGERASAADAAKRAAAEADAKRAALAAQLDKQRAAAAATLDENTALKAQVAKYVEEVATSLERLDKQAEARAAVERELKAAKDELAKERSAVAKLTNRLDASHRETEAAKRDAASAGEELGKLRAEVAGMGKELSQEMAAFKAAERTVARLDKEKADAEKRVAAEAARTVEAKAAVSAKAGEAAALETEVKRLALDTVKLRTVIASLERERERQKAAGEELSKAVAAREEALRLREAQVAELERREGELNGKLKAAHALYEGMRAERNSATKSLMAAQEEATELRRKGKVSANQLEQLKEDIHAKDKALIAEQFEAASLAKRLEQRGSEVEQLKRLLEEAAGNVARQDAELGQLQAALRRADADAVAQKRAFDALVAERDAVSAQLTRRNDELAQLVEKTALQATALGKGESQYAERLEDIRLLKLKVADLKRELQVVSLGQGAAVELRKQVHSLQRDLYSEQAKVRALSGELENPLNVHRWRKLEGSDPELFEMVHKYATLQKRLIAKTEEVVERDMALAEREKTLAELKARLVAAPGAELTEQLTTAQHLLSERTRQLKSLASEANMWQAQAAETRYEVERLQRELSDTKRQYYELARRAGHGHGGSRASAAQGAGGVASSAGQRGGSAGSADADGGLQLSGTSPPLGGTAAGSGAAAVASAAGNRQTPADAQRAAAAAASGPRFVGGGFAVHL